MDDPTGCGSERRFAVRYNATGYVILHIPFETTIHARKEVLAVDAELKLSERIKGDSTHPPLVGELMEMADVEDGTDLTGLVRSALPSAEVVVEHFEPGDPQDCDCAQCKRAEEAAFEEAKKASEPSIQTCTRCNLVQPYAHTLCTDCWWREVIQNAVDAVQPYANTLCTDCAHNLCDPEGCECEACKIEKAEEVATGQSWEPECDHKPDYASVRSCSSKDLGCEVQCSLCNRWGAFCVDDKSVGWGD